MKPKLRFRPDDPRVRRLNEQPVRVSGEYVLYFMQAYRRVEDNAALAWAIERANELGMACVVYEALRPDYPHASARVHRFVLEGGRDNARRASARGLYHVFFLPRVPEDARGVLARVAARAALVVSDDFPSFIVPAQNAAAARKVPCAYFVVDDCAVVPMALLGRQEVGARTIRPKVLRALGDWLLPLDDPRPRVPAPRDLDLGFEPIFLEDASIDGIVACSRVDQSVRPVEQVGGASAAEERLGEFVRGPLATYDVDRNDPSRDAGSGLSPYLHFGMVSARRVALEARESGRGEALDAFLEQLLVRRALSFNFARARTDHATYAALPEWARKTLEAHERDRRYADLTLAELEAARSPDPLWNAAMNELKATGAIRPYARMLWGKLPLLWMKSAARAHAALVHLNDKWALDGRDPNGYANVSWCFGLHDRPWPERPVFGTVRTMTSASARRKLPFEDYLTRWA